MKQVQTFKRKPRIFRYKQQAGQAVVEYILLLVIMISLLMTFKKVFKGLEEFMQNYMGDYIACLMEYGELPSLGVEDDQLKEHKGTGGGKTCESKYQKFSLAEGRPGTRNSESNSERNGRGGPSSTGGSSASVNRKSSQNAKSSSKTNRSETIDKSESSSSEVTSSRGRSSGANDRIIRSQGDYRTADNGETSTEADKIKIIEQSENGELGRGSQRGGTSSNRVVYDRTRAVGISGKLAEELKKQERIRRAPTTQVLPGEVDESGRIGPRKSVFTPPEPKREIAAESEDDSLNFGYFVKWIMIAGMGIAIFLFFGSQVMNFFNSQEK